VKIGLVIYGLLETLSGGYLYDRKLVEYLRAQGDMVEIVPLPSRNYAGNLSDNLWFRLPSGLDILIEDELNHPSLLVANMRRRPYPVLSLVHHLRSSEQRASWQNTLYRWAEKRFLRSVDGYIFNSRTTRATVHALVGEEKPEVVAHPPADRFGAGLAQEIVEARTAEAPPLRILFLGSVIPRKGLHTLLQAISLVEPGIAVLDIVGSLRADPPYVRDIRQLLERLGLSPTVHLAGPLEQDALVDHLRSAHVLAVPSSYEGFGIVYLEGMGFGLPAIGTTAGGAAEIITQGEDGFLVAGADPRTLADRLSALAGDRAMLRRMSMSALERYRRQPAWTETAARIRRFLVSMAT
jgi:glycosyltransferase involved in cell wall biosynthesis